MNQKRNFYSQQSYQYTNAGKLSWPHVGMLLAAAPLVRHERHSLTGGVADTVRGM